MSGLGGRGLPLLVLGRKALSFIIIERIRIIESPKDLGHTVQPPAVQPQRHSLLYHYTPDRDPPQILCRPPSGLEGHCKVLLETFQSKLEDEF